MELIDCNGREIREGDCIEVTINDLALKLAVIVEDGMLVAKNPTVIAYLSVICEGSDKVEIINR